MNATARRRNRLLTRLAVCAGGGLLVGGLVAIPFSGHDGDSVIGAASTSTAAVADASASTATVPVLTSVTTTAAGAPSSSRPAAAPTTAAAAPTSPPMTVIAAATTVATAPPTADPNAVATVPGVDAAAYVLVDGDTGRTLAASNADERHPVGSIMKLLTAYVVMQAGEPTKEVTVPPLDLAEGESRIFLSPGQHFRRDLLLRAMLIVSAGDAAEALAVDVAGTQQAFVAQMNAAAQSLGMHDTNAANADGLDADDGYSTASDVARLARVLMQDATFRETVVRRSATLFGTAFPATNTLLGSYPGATGIKTGHTTDAGYCLAAAARRNGRSLIAVVIGTPSKQARDATAAAVLDWGFAHPA